MTTEEMLQNLNDEIAVTEELMATIKAILDMEEEQECH